MRETASVSKGILLVVLALLMATPFLLSWDPLVSLAIRLVVFVPIVIWWHQVVDVAISMGLVHEMRKREAIAFRWRVLAMVFLIELLLIQQIPELFFAGFIT